MTDIRILNTPPSYLFHWKKVGRALEPEGACAMLGAQAGGVEVTALRSKGTKEQLLHISQAFSLVLPCMCVMEEVHCLI